MEVGLTHTHTHTHIGQCRGSCILCAATTLAVFCSVFIVFSDSEQKHVANAAAMCVAQMKLSRKHLSHEQGFVAVFVRRAF